MDDLDKLAKGLTEKLADSAVSCHVLRTDAVLPTRAPALTNAERTRFEMAFYSANAADPRLQEKFWAKVAKRGLYDCWEWTGSKTHRGYGAFAPDRKVMPAHRFAYHMANPDMDHTLVVDHICRNRGCVNPSHLRLMTNKENVLCGVGPTAVNAKKTACPKGHPYAGKNLCIDNRGRRVCRECTRVRKAKRNRSKAGLALKAHIERNEG